MVGVREKRPKAGSEGRVGTVPMRLVQVLLSVLIL